MEDDMETQEKEMPTAEGTDSGLEDDASDAPTSVTVADAERMTQDRPDRTPLQRACDLASHIAHEEGWDGMYGVVDGDVVWYSDDGRWSETVAFRLDDDELIVPDKQEIAHEPFVLAADLVLTQKQSVAPDVTEVAA